MYACTTDGTRQPERVNTKKNKENFNVFNLLFNVTVQVMVHFAL